MSKFLPFFFEDLQKSKLDPKLLARKGYEIKYNLMPYWGQIMHASTFVEKVLREHLGKKNGKALLGDLIQNFSKDNNAKKYPTLIKDLNKLNTKCRIIWSHGALTFKEEKGKIVAYLIANLKISKAKYKESRIKIDEKYLNKIMTIFNKVFTEFEIMFYAKDNSGKPLLHIKTPFIIPIITDQKKVDFTFVKP